MTYCIAHRGSHGDLPENSKSAVLKSVSDGIHGVEFDVRHTRDGIPILIHDSTLLRTARSKPFRLCSLEVPVNELYMQEIRESCELHNGEPVPLLEDVLESLKERDLFVFIEFKDMPAGGTLELLAQVYHNSSERVRLISFSRDRLDVCNSSQYDPVRRMKKLFLSSSGPETGMSSRPGRYGRWDAMASTTSATARIRASKRMLSPFSPQGYPDPSARS